VNISSQEEEDDRPKVFPFEFQVVMCSLLNAFILCLKKLLNCKLFCLLEVFS